MWKIEKKMNETARNSENCKNTHVLVAFGKNLGKNISFFGLGDIFFCLVHSFLNFSIPEVIGGDFWHNSTSSNGLKSGIWPKKVRKRSPKLVVMFSQMPSTFF